jgi:hypothetical protein
MDKPVGNNYANANNSTLVFAGLSYTPGAGFANAVEAQALSTRIAKSEQGVLVALKDSQETLQNDREEFLNANAQISALEKSVDGSDMVLASFERQFQANRKTWLDLLNQVRELAQYEYTLADAQASLVGSRLRLEINMDYKPLVSSSNQITDVPAPTTVTPDLTDLPQPNAQTVVSIVKDQTQATSAPKEVAEVVARDEAKQIVENPKEQNAEEKEKEKEEAVKLAIQNWAHSWAQKDIENYFLAYAPNFDPPGGLSRAQWLIERKQRILSKKKIHVSVSNFQIGINGTKAEINLLQIYESKKLKESSRKLLELTQQSGRWLITRETVN